MKKNNFNIRTCIYTKAKKSKAELIRFVISNNQLQLDIKQNICQRGYYLVNDEHVWKQIQEKKFFEKRFKINNVNDFFQSLENWKEIKNESKETNQERQRY